MFLKSLLKSFALALAVFASVTSVNAESYNWSGLYVGLNAGSNSERMNWAYTNPAPVTCCAPFSADANSIMYGAHIGYQHQFGMLVVGLEGSLIEPGNKFAAKTGCIASSTQTCETQISRVMTLGPRIGIGLSNWLLYGTGGYATGTINSSLVNSNNNAFDAGSGDQHGRFYGGGVEYAFTPSWIAGLEYQHIDLGTSFHASSADGFLGSPPGVNGRNIGAKDDVVRARISYKFNWGGRDEPVPLK